MGDIDICLILVCGPMGDIDLLYDLLHDPPEDIEIPLEPTETQQDILTFYWILEFREVALLYDTVTPNGRYRLIILL